MATRHSKQLSRSNRRLTFLGLLARLGYAARGIVHILVGGLAVLASFGPWGTTTGSRGALLVVMAAPLGWIWLGSIGTGLGLFALWRFAQSVLDADGLGTSLAMLGRRAAYFASAIANTGTAAFAVGLAVGLAVLRSDEEGGIQAWVAWILQQPYGAWSVMALGLLIIFSSLVMLWHAWDGSRIVEFLDCPGPRRWWVKQAGRIGFTARGIVFGLVGGFLVFSGYAGRSREARGLDGVLDSIAVQPYGWVPLAVTAAGLAAFGIFSILQAFYRSIGLPGLDDARDENA